MLAIVDDSLVGLIAVPVAVAGGAIAANDGESVGSVNPCVALGTGLVAAVEVTGGGANELVVEGVVKGATAELPGSA